MIDKINIQVQIYVNLCNYNYSDILPCPSFLKHGMHFKINTKYANTLIFFYVFTYCLIPLKCPLKCLLT